MSDEASFSRFLLHAHADPGQAAGEVYRRFADRLIGLARRQMDRRLQQKEDAEDVVQSVFRSFFRRQAGAGFEVREWDDLWALLSVIALHKCADRARHWHALRRDVRQELPADPGTPSWEALDREPTGEDVALLAETLDQMLSRLEPHERPMVSLALEGHSTDEISRQVGRARRTVQRILQHVKEGLEQLRDSGAAGDK